MKISHLPALALAALLWALPSHSQTGTAFEIMEQAVGTSPAVQAAEADMDRALATADRLRVGPYELEVSASGGQRTIDDPLASEDRYTEWSAGLSRTVRLPGKSRIDRDLARVETDISATVLAQALREERKVFVALWSEWRRADLLMDLSAQQADEATQIAELTQLAVDKGAERQVRADQLAADASMLQYQADMDRVAAEAARSKLAARYPDISFPARTRSLDLTTQGITELLEQPVEHSPVFKAARLRAEQARLQASRARAERLPDPTFGLEFGNEFGGQETSLMARITVPIGGGARRAYARELSASATIAELKGLGQERAFQQAVQSARLALQTSFSMLEKAQETATISEQVMNTIKAGYDLGDITLTELLTSRRSLIAAERIAMEQRAKLESDFLTLKILTDTQARN